MERAKLYFAVGLSALLVACASDDDDHDHDHDTKTYSFYINASGNLYAVDPSSPGSGSVEVKAGTNSLTIGDADGDGDIDAYYIQHGTYSSSTDQVSDIHYPNLVVLSGGNLYRINALVSAGTPVATQLSSSSSIPSVCGDDAVTNFSDSGASVFMFKEQTGADCGTSSWRAVTVGSDSTTAATNTKKLISGTYDASGTLTGFLMKDQATNNLATTDTSFANATLVKDPSNADIAIGSPRLLTPNRTGTIVFVDNKAPTGNMYAFNMTSGVITSAGVLHTFTNEWNDTAKDETYLFFDDTTSVYRAPRDGSAVATEIVSAVTTGVDKFAMTDNFIIYHNGNGDVYKVAKDAASSVAESTLTAVVTGADDLYASGPWIFYNQNNIAHYVHEDGTTGSGQFDGAYSATPANGFGAMWVGPARENARSDEIPKEKGDMILFAASSDTSNAIYSITPGSSTLGTSVLEIPSSINVDTGIDADDREGHYALFAITGAAGAVYVLDGSTDTSTRVDDLTDSSGDEATNILSPN